MPYKPPLHRSTGVDSYADRRALRDRTRSPSRTYGRRWRLIRATYLAHHPVCECEQQCGGMATVVDHRIPHRGDRRLMYDWNNLQAMTKPCHDRKTVMRDGGFGRT